MGRPIMPRWEIRHIEAQPNHQAHEAQLQLDKQAHNLDGQAHEAQLDKQAHNLDGQAHEAQRNQQAHESCVERKDHQAHQAQVDRLASGLKQIGNPPHPGRQAGPPGLGRLACPPGLGRLAGPPAQVDRQAHQAQLERNSRLACSLLSLSSATFLFNRRKYTYFLEIN